MCAMEYYSAIRKKKKKQENPAICNNMGGWQGHYAMWNKRKENNV